MKPAAMVANAQRELRELVSYRKSLVQDKNRDLNRLQKMLKGANIESRRAYVAVAHSMLIAIYHILKDGEGYKDLGLMIAASSTGSGNQFLYKKLKSLGWDPSEAMAGQPV